MPPPQMHRYVPEIPSTAGRAQNVISRRDLCGMILPSVLPDRTVRPPSGFATGGPMAALPASLVVAVHVATIKVVIRLLRTPTLA